jgi:fucose permease
MTRTDSPGARPKSRPLLLLVLAFAGFISLGLPDAVLGIAWPSLRADFALKQTALGWILAGGAVGYFTSGLFSGRLIERAGVGTLLFGSTTLVVAGVVGYAVAPSIAVFVLAALVVGLGSGAIDSGLNAHGAHNFRPGQMAWLHAAYSAGAALGSFTMAQAALGKGGVRAGYGLVAGLLAGLAIAFFFTRRFWSSSATRGEAIGPSSGSGRVGALAALGMSRVRLGILSFFVYSGVELGAGHWAYSILVQSRGFSTELAGLVVSAYWASIFGGRVIAGFVVERVGNVRLVRYGAVLAAAGAAAFASTLLPDFVSATGLVVVGLALAPIYPGLMSETPAKTGNAAAYAVGFQVSAAAAGGIGLPALGGFLAETFSLEATALLVASCAAALLVLSELFGRGVEHRRASADFDTHGGIER